LRLERLIFLKLTLSFKEISNDNLIAIKVTADTLSLNLERASVEFCFTVDFDLRSWWTRQISLELLDMQRYLFTCYSSF